LEEGQVGRKNLFITGSSNLTRAGLTTQEEFNVEISDFGFDDAEKYFDALWGEAVKITEHAQAKQKLVEIVEKETLIKQVTPFEAFVLVLKTHFSLYSTRRILVRQIPGKPYCVYACLVEESLLNDLNSMNVINIKDAPELLLGIINSRLISFWFIHKFGKLQRGTFPQFKVNELAMFPIVKNRELYKQEIVKFVKKIMEAKAADPSVGTEKYDQEIDQMVYKLYGLTEEEIRIVESDSSAKSASKLVKNVIAFRRN
jgi:hypothetical protein